MSGILSRTRLAWIAHVLAAGTVAAPAAALPGAPPFVAAPAPASATVAVDLRSTHGFMLVVVEADRRLERSEAYGDWQYYLQSFIERRRGDLPVHQVTPEQARALLPNWPSGLRNATLFANAQGRGLLHSGLVLEPKVYVLGKSFAEHGSIAPESASFGLQPFSWKDEGPCGPVPASLE